MDSFFGLETTFQQKLVQLTADKLALQGPLINACEECPRCQHRLIKGGKMHCEVHALNTDHTIDIQKYRCPVCHWSSSDSIKTMYGTAIYRPEDLQSINENENIIKNKTCVASAKEDEQDSMKIMIVNAAKRAGMTSLTKVTAFSDGAVNCKCVINALSNHCGQLTAILDWFHISMKFQNILASSALADDLKQELKNAKWKLWHGLKEDCYEKLHVIMNKTETTIHE